MMNTLLQSCLQWNLSSGKKVLHQSQKKNFFFRIFFGTHKIVVCLSDHIILVRKFNTTHFSSWKHILSKTICMVIGPTLDSFSIRDVNFMESLYLEGSQNYFL